MSFHEHSTHAVILFPKQRGTRQKLVELVPKSWVSKEGRQYYCQYPDEKDYGFIDQWVIDSRSPEPGWSKIDVQILKEAVGYDQGLRRLERSYKTADIESSTANEGTDGSSSSESGRAKTSEASRAVNTLALKKAFEDIPPFPSDAESATHSSAGDYTEVSSSSDASPPPKKLKKGSDPGRSNGTPKSHVMTEQTRRRLKLTTPNSRSGESHRSEQRKCTADGEKRNNNNEEIVRVIAQGFTAMHEQTKKRFDSMKRSLLYELNQKFESIQNTLAINTNTQTAEDMTQVKTVLGVKQLPFKTLKDFTDFNNNILTDTETKKEAALIKFMLSISRGCSSVKDGIAKILSSLMSKEVQLQYSACGRIQKGNAKENLSQTVVFKCMRDVLLQTFENTKIADIISKTSRWLAGAGDREGGKKDRAEKPTTPSCSSSASLMAV